MKQFIIAALVLICIACKDTDCSQRRVDTTTSQGMIMLKTSHCYSISKSANRFVPKRAVIEELETLLSDQIKKLNKAHPNQLSEEDYIENSLSEYNRQYFGYLNENNEKEIFINLFKEPLDCKMNMEWVVLDGCSDYWQITYVLRTHQFKDFSVNGCS